MQHATDAVEGDDVLDLCDIILITMSSSSLNGRIMAASTCSCGNVDLPAAYGARSQPAPAPSGTVGARLRRGVERALRSIRGS